MIFRRALGKIKRASAVAIGNFDGFHIGHKKIIATLGQLAKEQGLDSVVLTFFPHPRILLKHRISLIHTDRQRRDILRGLPVSYLFFVDFKKIINLSAEEFIQKILLKWWRMEIVVLGDDFRFGHDRLGDSGFLRAKAEEYGFRVRQIEPQIIDGRRVSSSAIRKLLMKGDMASASRMLGVPYFIDGRVVKGAERGRKLGFPTINISSDNDILPRGVFHTVVEVSGQRYRGLANIGSRPTFGGDKKKVEVHLLNFNRAVYGNKVRVFFLKKIRDEKKFASDSDLIAQIRSDIGNLPIDKEALF